MKQRFNLSIPTIKFPLHWLLCWTLSWHLNNTMSLASQWLTWLGIWPRLLTNRLLKIISVVSLPGQSSAHTSMSASLVAIQNDSLLSALKEYFVSWGFLSFVSQVLPGAKMEMPDSGGIRMTIGLCKSTACDYRKLSPWHLLQESQKQP